MLKTIAILVGLVNILICIMVLGTYFWEWPLLLPQHVYKTYQSNPGFSFWSILSILILTIATLFLSHLSAERKHFFHGYATATSISCFCYGFFAYSMAFMGNTGIFIVFAVTMTNSLKN